MIKVMGTFLDTMHTISKEVEAGFFANLNRELDIHDLEVDGFNLYELIKLGYKEITSFLEAYQTGELNQDLDVYMALLNHNYAGSTGELINKGEEVLESGSIDDFDFKKNFSMEQAQAYIEGLSTDEEIQKRITLYFDYEGYERDIFINCYKHISYRKTQLIVGI
jgi:antirestriction protein